MLGYVVRAEKGYFTRLGLINEPIYTSNINLAYCYDTKEEAEQVIESLEITAVIEEV